MSNPLLGEAAARPAMATIAIAVGFAALALGLGNPARADALVTGEQADAAAVAARETESLEHANVDQRIVHRTVWSADAAAAANQATAWFPATPDEESTTIPNLALNPSPMRTPNLATGAALAAQTASVIPNEHAVIPLPAGAWTGLAGLAWLGTMRSRKAIVRFFFT